MNYSVSLLNDDGNQQFQSNNYSRVIPLNKSKKLKCNWWIITLSVVLSLLLLVGLGFIIYISLRDNIIVKNEFDFKNIPKKVRSIIITENVLNNLDTEWKVSDYSNLKKLVIKAESLQNIKSFVVCNNPVLTSIRIEKQAFYNTINLKLNSNYIFFK